MVKAFFVSKNGTQRTNRILLKKILLTITTHNGINDNNLKKSSESSSKSLTGNKITWETYFKYTVVRH